MDTQYRVLLPTILQERLGELETVLGADVAVRPRSSLALPSHIPRDLWVADYGAGPSGRFDATIGYVEEPSVLSAHKLAHELLHIHRSVVQRAYRIYAIGTSDEDIQRASDYENDIEHLSIVPQEIQMFPEALVYWRNDADRSVRQLLSGPIRPHPKEVTRLATVLPLIAPNFSDEGRLITLATAMGVEEKAAEMRKNLVNARSKIDQAFVLLSGLGMINQFELGRYPALRSGYPVDD